MDSEHAIKSLKRVHDSAVRAEKASAPVVVEEYNEVLGRLKDEYPDNGFIQSVEKITEDVYKPVTTGATNFITPENALERVKVKTEQLADSLGLGGEFDRPSVTNQMQRIVIQQETSQSNIQEVEQRTSVESINQLIDLDPEIQNEKSEIKDIVSRFEAELDSENPDPNVLRKFIQNAKGYSTSVAAKMAIICLERGITDILGI